MKAVCAQVSDYGVEETLQHMPQDMDATYEKILDAINGKPPAQRELARRALLFIAYAREPVSIDELALAIAVKDHTQSLDILRSSISAEEKILHACGNLLSIDDTDPKIRRARFVHFSVHEFLTSHRSKLFHTFSLECEVANREISRICIVFLLILYSGICYSKCFTAVEKSFVDCYILPALPHHLLAGNLNSLPSNGEMINLILLFFEKGPPMLAPRIWPHAKDIVFFTFSPSVLALIFNLPGTYQPYNPQILCKKSDKTALCWVYGGKFFEQVFDDRLAMHYAIGRLDSVAIAERLYTHGYPIEYSYHHSDGPLNTFNNYDEERFAPEVCNLTPLYLVKSKEVAGFLLNKGASVNPQDANGALPNLLGHLMKHGNTKVIQFLIDHGAEKDEEAQVHALQEVAFGGNIATMQFLLDQGVGVNGRVLENVAKEGNIEAVRLLLNNRADPNARGGHYGNALQAASFAGSTETMRLLLDEGANPNAEGGFYGNALQAASSKGEIEAVRLLLDKGVDVNMQGGHYGNALQAAAKSGNIETVRLLIDKGADVNAQGGSDKSALQAAASSGNTDIMLLLLDEGADIMVGGNNGKALYAAANCGNVEAMRILLNEGADSHAQGGYYGNALQAAVHSGSIEAVRLLLDKGVDVNTEGGCCGNALQTAAEVGNVETMRLLLDKGADVNMEGGEFGSTLQAAAHSGVVEAVQLLLDEGANVNAQGGYFGNALVASISNIEAMQILLDAGAEVDMQGNSLDPQGNSLDPGTALQAAAVGDNIEAMQILLDKGAHVNVQGGWYGNALQAASFNGNTETMRLLLDEGADSHAQGGYYGNAMQAAAHSGNAEAVRLLLDKGVDVNMQGGLYGNALQATACHGNVEVMRLFLSKGADVNAQGGRYGNALQAAAANGNVKAMRLLLDEGVDINAQGGEYGTALQAALKPSGIYRRTKNELYTAEVLLDHGADVTAYVPGSKYGDVLSAAKEIWKDNEIRLAKFMKLLEEKGWKGDRLGTPQSQQ